MAKTHATRFYFLCQCGWLSQPGRYSGDFTIDHACGRPGGSPRFRERRRVHLTVIQPQTASSEE